MESLPYEKEAYVQSINLFLAVDTPIVADVSSYKGNFKNVQLGRPQPCSNGYCSMAVVVCNG